MRGRFRSVSFLRLAWLAPLVLAAALVVSRPAPAAAPESFRLYGAAVKPRHWNWLRAAHVPMPAARIWMFRGDAEYVWQQSVIFLPRPGRGGWEYKQERILLLHELGHAFDRTHLTPGLRNEFKLLAGASDCSWWAKRCVTARRVSGPGVFVNVPPAEMFAEAYAACGLGLTRRQVEDGGHVTYGWDPPDGADQAACALINRAAS